MLGASKNIINILKRGNAASSCRRLSVSDGVEMPARTSRAVASKISASASPAQDGEQAIKDMRWDN